MKFMGHTVEAKPKGKGSQDGQPVQLYAYIDGKIDRSIPPSPYRGIIFRRIKQAYQDRLRRENDREH